jgi:Zinc carboxypeptidase
MVRMGSGSRKTSARALALAAALLAVTGCDVSESWTGPRTEAEKSGYARTSTSAQVAEFVEACAARSPLLKTVRIGESTRKKPLLLTLAADPPVATIEEARRDPRLKVLVMANIHAGEVEGKEAVQVYLREIAQGLHAGVTKKIVVAFVPNYNPDGNDQIDRKNRPDQAGPVEGVGVRHQGMDLDLNRDYLKVEAPETEALIRTVNALDACLVTDLHTTNGSFHGYDLTYAGPLHPGTDPGILEFERKEFLPELQKRMRGDGFETFDYGNWVDEKDPSKGWESFEARPRFGNSYFGLCNRLTLLSEAYSHDPFEKRIRSTYALVRRSLELVAERDAAIRRTLEAAARFSGKGPDGTALALPTRAKLVQTEASRMVPVGGVRDEKDPVTGLVRQWDDDVSAPVAMPVFAWFEGVRPRPVPAGWIVKAPSEKLRRVLDVHGLAAATVDRDRRAKVESFRIKSVRARKPAFQGHELKSFEGAWAEVAAPAGTVETIPKGSVYIRADQPLGRLAFALFEPESDDGLGTWDLLGAEGDEGGVRRFEAIHLLQWDDG